MNFKQMQDRVLSLLQQSGSTGYYGLDDVKSWLNEAYSRIITIMGGRESIYFTNSVAGQMTYTIDDAILKVNKVYFNGSKYPLKPTNFDNLVTSSGTPRCYIIRDKTLYLSPVPSTVSEIKILCNDEVDDLSGDSDTTILPKHLQYDMVNFAVSMGKLKRDDMGSYGNLVNMWTDVVTYDIGRFRNYMNELHLPVQEGLDGDYSDY